jgi:NTE family protein
MDNSKERPVSPTSEQLHVDLRRLEWAKELSEETLTSITNTAEWVGFHGGEVVIDLESELSHVYFIITGRVQATLYDRLGKEIQKDTMSPGLAVGLVALGSKERSLLHVEAIEPSTAIRLAVSDLLHLAAEHAEFQRAIFRMVVSGFKRYVMADRSLPKPAVVGIVHHSEASRPLAGRLARRLRELDESPCVAGDDEQWKPDGDTPFRLFVGGQLRENRLSVRCFFLVMHRSFSLAIYCYCYTYSPYRQ